MSNLNNPVERFPHAFLASHLTQLSDRIHTLSLKLFRRHGIAVEPKCVSVLMLVAHSPLSAADIANTLALSHQLVTQRLNKLKKGGYLQVVPDTQDARRRVATATELGKAEILRILPVLEALDRVFESIFEQVGDLPDLLRRTQQNIDIASISDIDVVTS